MVRAGGPPTTFSVVQLSKRKALNHQGHQEHQAACAGPRAQRALNIAASALRAEWAQRLGDLGALSGSDSFLSRYRSAKSWVVRLRGSRQRKGKGVGFSRVEMRPPISYTAPTENRPDLPMPKDEKNDIAALTFEQALQQLEQIVQRLEKGQVELEDSIAIYERGTALKAHCEAKLRDAEARIEKIVIGPGGQASTAPFDQK
jgi:exodeoxyribonuclease VII small subunit